jgi:DNA-binding SARP family transcriptional activator
MDVWWRIELLGGLQAVRGDRVVTRFRTQKTGILLAYLAYYRQRAHPREALIELLWGDDDFDAGRHSLSVALSSLRQQLEPPGVPAGAVFLTDRTSARLNPQSVSVDVADLEELLRAAARAGDRAERAACLARATELYRGELLAGYYERWILGERERLAEAHLQALHELTAHLKEVGDWQGALQQARRAVSADPVRHVIAGRKGTAT